MIMAMDANKLIGKAGGLPWYIPGELAYFKKVTMGKPVVMGRKTFDSIGKPLPGRTNIVVTRNANWSAEGVIATQDLNAALLEGDKACDEMTNSQVVDSGAGAGAGVDNILVHSEMAQSDSLFKDPEIMIIGGAALCREAMPVTDRLYLTMIEQVYEGDTWLDSFNEVDWREISRNDQQHEALRFSYRILARI